MRACLCCFLKKSNFLLYLRNRGWVFLKIGCKPGNLGWGREWDVCYFSKLPFRLHQRNFSVRPETFLGANTFFSWITGEILRYRRNRPTFFLKIWCESGKFRVLLFSSLLAPCAIFDSFSPFGKFLEGARFTRFSFRQCLNMKGPVNTSSNRNKVETLAGFDSVIANRTQISAR